METVVFVGIDTKNRPIFRDSRGRYYGATDKLFYGNATREEVLPKVTEADLTYFGDEFDCEPMGTQAGNIRIDRPKSTP